MLRTIESVTSLAVFLVSANALAAEGSIAIGTQLYLLDRYFRLFLFVLNFSQNYLGRRDF